MSGSRILNAVHVRPCRLLLQYQQQMLTVTGNAWVIMGGDEVQRPALAERLAKRISLALPPASNFFVQKETKRRDSDETPHDIHTTTTYDIPYKTHTTRRQLSFPAIHIHRLLFQPFKHFRHPAQPLRDSRSRHPSLPTYLVTQRLLTPVCTQPTTTYRNVL